jgi:hypothetical protein
MLCSVVLVTGLAGHAYGSWHAGTGKMWAEEFLSSDFPDTRVMTYGYNSTLIETADSRTWRDYTSEFLQYVANTRTSHKV